MMLLLIEIIAVVELKTGEYVELSKVRVYGVMREFTSCSWMYVMKPFLSDIKIDPKLLFIVYFKSPV